mgnify:CR=1 FL=1
MQIFINLSLELYLKLTKFNNNNKNVKIVKAFKNNEIVTIVFINKEETKSFLHKIDVTLFD